MTSVINLDPTCIDVDPRLALRTFDPSKSHHRQLLQSIKSHGVHSPLRVRATQPGSGRVTVLDGHLRLGAVRSLLAEGHRVPTVPCIVEARI